MSKPKILVVDDEEDLCEILQFNLEAEGYDVDVAHSAEEVLQTDASQYNLLLLDVMMDEMSGFQLAKILHEREATAQLPIIFVTAKNTENDTLTGFHLGADDYISKPFSLQQVAARVKAVLRRTTASNNTGAAAAAPEHLHIDNKTKRLIADGTPVQLTRKEFDLASLLIASPLRIFSRDEIIDSVWPEDICITVHTVDVHMSRLKKKLGEYGKCFVNRQGFGYYYTPDDKQQ